MGYYAVPGSHSAVSSSYKTAALVQAATTAAALRRGKVFEVMVGASANPNATDTYIQWDISRITASGAGAYTSWTPTALDPADVAALCLAGITATAEATTITANSSIWNEAVNQRGSLRWVAAQESQYMIFPGTASAGLILRGLSSTYTGTTTGQLTYQE
jgi:hypothetical protein